MCPNKQEFGRMVSLLKPDASCKTACIRKHFNPLNTASRVESPIPIKPPKGACRSISNKSTSELIERQHAKKKFLRLEFF